MYLFSDCSMICLLAVVLAVMIARVPALISSAAPTTDSDRSL